MIGRFQHKISDNECGIIIQWARGESEAKYGPGVNMNFKTKFDDNWNHEYLNGDNNYYSFRYNHDLTKERVDGGKLEIIRFWWDKVSDIIIALSKNTN